MNINHDHMTVIMENHFLSVVQSFLLLSGSTGFLNNYHMLGSCSLISFYEMAKIVPLPTILALNGVGSCVDLQHLKRSKRLES